MEKEKLYRLIDRYYQADTTLEEERELLRELLRPGRRGDRENEALAVMGYPRMAPGKSRGKKNPLRGYMVRGTAAACALIIIGTGLLTVWGPGWRNPDAQPQCIAYVGGERVDDTDMVMSLINEQLSEMSAVSAEMDNEIAGDFNDIRNALSVEDL